MIIGYLLHLCQDLMGIAKQAYLGGAPAIMPPWGGAGGWGIGRGRKGDGRKKGKSADIDEERC